MQIIQSRRDFLASLSAAGAAGAPWRSGIARRRGAAGDDHDPAGLTYPASASRPLHRRGAAARGRVHRYPLRATTPAGRRDDRARRSRLRLQLRGMDRRLQLDAGEPITALAGVHSGLLRAVRARAHPSVSDLKGKSVGIQALGSSRPPLPRDHGGACRARPAARTSIGSTQSARQRHGAVRRKGKIDAFLGFPPEPQELRARKIGRVIVNTAIGQAMVAVFLLHAVRQQGVRPRSSGRDQALAARHPQGRRHLRRRAGAGRAAAGRWRVRGATTTTRSRR